jgi:hypothetical protein
MGKPISIGIVGMNLTEVTGSSGECAQLMMAGYELAVEVFGIVQ